MADPKPAAGGASSGSDSSGASSRKQQPWWVDTFLDLFGHRIGNAAMGLLTSILTRRQERQEKAQVRLPNFGHIMTLLQAQNRIAYAQICDLMQFLASDADRADMQYHVAGIGGDADPQPSVDFLIQLAGQAQSTGQAGLQEMKDYLNQLGYIGSRAEDQLEAAKRYAQAFGVWTAGLPGRAVTGINTTADSAAQSLSDAVKPGTTAGDWLAKASIRAEAGKKRRADRWNR